MAATKSLSRLYESAMECRRIHEEAGLKLPEPLVRFFGEGEDDDGRPRLIIPPPVSPPRPPQARPDWIWVKASDLTTKNLTLGVLLATSKPMVASDISEYLEVMGIPVSKGTIGNAGTRMFGELIERRDDGWVLMPDAPAPVLHEGYAWGPVDLFDVTELASHRRAGIAHLLRVQSDGMQIAQIVNAMTESCSWNRAPVSKDIVKADMEYLDSAGVAKRVGNSGKWRVTG